MEQVRKHIFKDDDMKTKKTRKKPITPKQWAKRLSDDQLLAGIEARMKPWNIWPGGYPVAEIQELVKRYQDLQVKYDSACAELGAMSEYGE